MIDFNATHNGIRFINGECSKDKKEITFSVGHKLEIKVILDSSNYYLFNCDTTEEFFKKLIEYTKKELEVVNEN